MTALIERKVEVSEYGLFLLSADRMQCFLKDNQIRSKKLLSHFQKEHELYLKSIEHGVWLPILPIDSVEYVVQVNDSFDKEWQECLSVEGFNLDIGEDGSLWVGSVSNLLNWDQGQFSNDRRFNSYETLDGEECFSSQRFDVVPGKYLVSIKGFKRRIEREYPETNFGYQFELISVQSFDGYQDPREDELYNFNVAQV